MIFNKEIEKLKEGCGKSLLKTPSYCLCGDATHIKTNRIALCEICRAKIEATEHCNQKVEEFVKELKEAIDNTPQTRIHGSCQFEVFSIIDNLIKQSQEGKEE